jgi:hypothetical protein
VDNLEDLLVDGVYDIDISILVTDPNGSNSSGANPADGDLEFDFPLDAQRTYTFTGQATFADGVAFLPDTSPPGTNPFSEVQLRKISGGNFLWYLDQPKNNAFAYNFLGVASAASTPSCF